jgi:hypothetical protein
LITNKELYNVLHTMGMIISTDYMVWKLSAPPSTPSNALFTFVPLIYMVRITECFIATVDLFKLRCCSTGATELAAFYGVSGNATCSLKACSTDRSNRISVDGSAPTFFLPLACRYTVLVILAQIRHDGCFP